MFIIEHRKNSNLTYLRAATFPTKVFLEPRKNLKLTNTLFLPTQTKEENPPEFEPAIFISLSIPHLHKPKHLRRVPSSNLIIFLTLKMKSTAPRIPAALDGVYRNSGVVREGREKNLHHEMLRTQEEVKIIPVFCFKVSRRNLKYQ